MAMNITMRQLTVFQSVAANLSYTKAAAALHLTQPAVSMQIRQLEENLGLPLFEQIGKKVFLTTAGQEMVHYSRAIAQQMTEIEEVFAGLKGVEGGTLKLAVPGTANAFMTRFLAEFCHRYPQIKLSLTIANRAGLLRLLAHNETDLVVMGQPPDGLDLVSHSFMDNPLVVIAAPDHPLAGRQKRVSLAKLLEQPFVIREPGSGTRIAMERFFAEQKIALQAGMEVSSNESIKQAVAAGLGLGIVSIHTLEMELALERVVVLKAERFPIMRHWYIVNREGKRLAPVAEAFLSFVTDEAVPLWPLADAAA